MAKVELWPVVDDNDQLIRYATEEECHGEPKLLHRTVFVAVFNSDFKILMQQRKLTKPLYPGFWTLSATGHVIKNESYTEAARREYDEELGEAPKKRLTEVTRARLDVPEHPTFSALFKTISDGPFYHNEDEIEQLRFFSIAELKEMTNQLTTPLQMLLRIAKFI